MSPRPPLSSPPTAPDGCAPSNRVMPGITPALTSFSEIHKLVSAGVMGGI